MWLVNLGVGGTTFCHAVLKYKKKKIRFLPLLQIKGYFHNSILALYSHIRTGKQRELSKN